MRPDLKILIVDANPVRAAIIDEGLREAGFTDLVRIGATHGLVAEIERHDPDVLVIDLEDPSRDALADMFLVSKHVRRPITMFVDQSDSALIEAAVEAGVSAYIVDGLEGADAADPADLHQPLQRLPQAARGARRGSLPARGPQADRPRQGSSCG